MTEAKRSLIVLMTHGADHELSSVGFTIACGGITSGLDVGIFLTSASVDLARKRAIESTVVPPLSPLRELMQDYEQVDLIEGVIISGASVVHDRIKQGAATLSF